MTAFANKTRRVLLAGVALALVAGLCGCDDLFSDSPYNGWDTGWGYDYGYGYDWGYPDYGLYDPTDTIQGVVDYRTSVMDSTAAAWDDYIRQ
ncbi:MAG: hypothetical protein JXO22_10785 [Phycisphaerae bacterium]|nr:hypothetical protein [Phycisphaerae bacterium]